MCERCKVIQGEECASHHKLLVCDLYLTFKIPLFKPFVPKVPIWNLRYPNIHSDFRRVVRRSLAPCDPTPFDCDTIWEVLKTTHNQKSIKLYQ